MGSYSSALVPETEEFHSIVSLAGMLSEQVTPMEDEAKENPSAELASPKFSDNAPSLNGPGLPRAAPGDASTQSFSSLLPKALSAALHPPSLPGLTSYPQPSSNPGKRSPSKLDQLQTDLRDLRGQFDRMKSQHNKEIKLLMNELDEEKRIRLTLQMEIQRMKKHMSK